MAALPQTQQLPDGIRASDLSFGRFLRGVTTGDWTGAEAERRTVMQVGIGSAGGYLVPEPLSLNVIDMARNTARVLQAGARTVPMEATTLMLVRQTGDVTGYWRGENQDITESNATFDTVRLEAKVLGALVRISIEAVEDATNLSDILNRSFANALALELDRVLLLGSGVGPEPQGVYSTPGVNILTMGDDGAALTDYDPFSRAVELVRTANGEPNAVIFSARTAGELDRLKSAVDAQPLQPPQSFRDLTRLTSNQVPNGMEQGTATDASAAFVGAWQNQLVGIRKQLIVEPFRAGDADGVKKMQVVIRAYLRADAVVVRPSHFAIIKGITPP